MQYIHPFRTRREIEHSENSGFISHANFLHRGTDTRHRLPILRIEPALDPVRFKAQRILRGFRKPSYVLRLLPIQTTGFTNELCYISQFYAISGIHTYPERGRNEIRVEMIRQFGGERGANPNGFAA